MSANDRINAMNEAEAKAALLGIVKREGRFRYCTRSLLAPQNSTEEECANEILDEAIKEGKKWQV